MAAHSTCRAPSRTTSTTAARVAVRLATLAFVVSSAGHVFASPTTAVDGPSPALLQRGARAEGDAACGKAKGTGKGKSALRVSVTGACCRWRLIVVLHEKHPTACARLFESNPGPPGARSAMLRAGVRRSASRAANTPHIRAQALATPTTPPTRAQGLPRAICPCTQPPT